MARYVLIHCSMAVQIVYVIKDTAVGAKPTTTAGPFFSLEIRSGGAARPSGRFLAMAQIVPRFVLGCRGPRRLDVPMAGVLRGNKPH